MGFPVQDHLAFLDIQVFQDTLDSPGDQDIVAFLGRGYRVIPDSPVVAFQDILDLVELERVAIPALAGLQVLLGLVDSPAVAFQDILDLAEQGPVVIRDSVVLANLDFPVSAAQRDR